TFHLLYSSLLNSVQICSIVSLLLYSILDYSITLCCILFYSAPFYYILTNSILLYSILFYVIMRCCFVCQVGILDVDLCGPSIPQMLNAGWVPVYADPQQQLALMSIGFLLEDSDEAVVWRGPKKTALIGQFVSDVAWGELDVLLVDTPPGTSDKHLAVLENLRKHRVDGAVLVTTPQVNITMRREITFCKKTAVKILGIVENMSGFVCTLYFERSNIFSKGGGDHWICSVPLDPLLTVSLEEGRDFLQAFPESSRYTAISHIANTLLSSLDA
uniref:Nucleotide binding protein 2 (MinD homolog, E. coli) n=1 Tax=Sinocyclocheilus grahami TaxID=75366 RepID=A0A672RVK4_SINGR